MQGYGGSRSGGVPGARAASNKMFSNDEVSSRGVFFRCWIGGLRLFRAEIFGKLFFVFRKLQIHCFMCISRYSAGVF